MRSNGKVMGTDDEKSKHNPDSANLKSLLKKSDKKTRKKHHVIFNENKNEFFDADYIILIREECEYEDDEDDGICTCNQQELVHVTCDSCCNSNVFEDSELSLQSPKFAPPFEFVDTATLSPPEGYKDMEMEDQNLFVMNQGQRTVVCRECRASHEDKGISFDSFTEKDIEYGNSDIENEKIDKYQQTTPTTPPTDMDIEDYVLEMANNSPVVQDDVLNQAEEDGDTSNSEMSLYSTESSVLGILKGGRFWKNQEINFSTNTKTNNPEHLVCPDSVSHNRRSVRFVESTEQEGEQCNELLDNTVENNKPENITSENISTNTTTSEDTEMMLTFKLGNHVLISNNSLKPNSAVRQLFPCTKPSTVKDSEVPNKYLITAESLRAFEEAERSKLPQLIQSGNTNENIKRVIERNTLRRSLIRYEPKNKKITQKVDNSLVELIKQLTCNVDDENQKSDDVATQISPTENTNEFLEVNCDLNKCNNKSYSPSSSSTTSSNSSSNSSSTYKKISDLFNKREKVFEVQSISNEPKAVQTISDVENSSNDDSRDANKFKLASVNDSKKQFLSTLAPLTACVSNMSHSDDSYYNISNAPYERKSVTSTVYTECTLNNIDEVPIDRCDNSKYIAPDVLAGTPLPLESKQELTVFVDQDGSRTERVKNEHQHNQHNKDKDEEHDDYGFNKRPSVQSIKSQFGTSTTVFSQSGTEMKLPVASTIWPYYSESGLSENCASNKVNVNQNISNYQYSIPEEIKSREFAVQHSGPAQEDNLHQKCSGQRFFETIYKSNLCTYSVGIDQRCTDKSISRAKYSKPLSPPPQEISRSCQQTMVYIPYNHIECYQSVISPNICYQPHDILKVSNQNEINSGHTEPIYAQHVGYFCNPNIMSTFSQKTNKPPLFKPLQHFSTVSSKNESMFTPFFSARSTQTSTTMPTYKWYKDIRSRRVASEWNGGNTYSTKVSCNVPSSHHDHEKDIGCMDSSDNSYNEQLTNGFRQSIEINNYLSENDSIQVSPVKAKFVDRGVPEGAVGASTLGPSTITHSNNFISPTGAQNSNSKFLFYAMNV